MSQTGPNRTPNYKATYGIVNTCCYPVSIVLVKLFITATQHHLAARSIAALGEKLRNQYGKKCFGE